MSRSGPTPRKMKKLEEKPAATEGGSLSDHEEKPSAFGVGASSAEEKEKLAAHGDVSPSDDEKKPVEYSVWGGSPIDGNEMTGYGRGSPSDYEEEQEDEMDETLTLSLKDLNKCQKELEELDEKTSQEMSKVEAKYNKLRKPYYKKRAAIIAKIPNFWMTALSNHDETSMMVTEDEVECLNFLKKLEVEEFENGEDGFRIKLFFEDNPFFRNKVLVKELQLQPEPKSTSTKIKWKRNMNFTKNHPQILEARKERGFDENTFFGWFNDNEDPTDDTTADIIRLDLWPNPLQYYQCHLDLDSDDEDSSSLSSSDDSEEDKDDDDTLKAKHDSDSDSDVHPKGDSAK